MSEALISAVNIPIVQDLSISDFKLIQICVKNVNQTSFNLGVVPKYVYSAASGIFLEITIGTEIAIMLAGSSSAYALRFTLSSDGTITFGYSGGTNVVNNQYVLLTFAY